MNSMLSSRALMFSGINPTGVNSLIDYYNKHVVPLLDPTRIYYVPYGSSWCAVFTSVVGHLIGCDSEYYPYGCSVKLMVEDSKKRSMFTSNVNDAVIDDILIYDWSGDGVGSHVGFIIHKDENLFNVVEGNYKGTVGIRTIRKDSDFILGVIRL